MVLSGQKAVDARNNNVPPPPTLRNVGSPRRQAEGPMRSVLFLTVVLLQSVRSLHGSTTQHFMKLSRKHLQLVIWPPKVVIIASAYPNLPALKLQGHMHSGG